MTESEPPDDLHRLALNYRGARIYEDTVDAWFALEQYVGQQVNEAFEAGRAYEAGLRDAAALLAKQPDTPETAAAKAAQAKAIFKPFTS